MVQKPGRESRKARKAKKKAANVVVVCVYVVIVELLVVDCRGVVAAIIVGVGEERSVSPHRPVCVLHVFVVVFAFVVVLVVADSSRRTLSPTPVAESYSSQPHLLCLSPATSAICLLLLLLQHLFLLLPH
jgi:hypothetical protein